MSSSDAVQREADWLADYSSGDGLPGLLTSAGGPFDVVQAYRRRTPPGRSNQLYVTRPGFRVQQFGLNRRINHYTFRLRIVWPLSSRRGDAESVQQALDDAVDLVVQRVIGPLALPIDRTHGARFMSVAVDAAEIDVRFLEPQTITPDTVLEAWVTYTADDKDYTA